MNIGIYFPNVKPEIGGGSTLLNTIQKEIKESKDTEDNYYFLYDGKWREPLTKEFEDSYYINLGFYRIGIFKKKIISKIKKLLHLHVSTVSKFNIVAKDFPIDIFWFPSPIDADLDYPYIYTVWDLGHRCIPYFPEVSRSGWTWNQRETCYQKMLYKASYVITGNEEGKKQIIENYPMPPNKIRISSFPVSSFCHGKEEKPSFEVPEQFFFYPAQFWPHKNHICILDALVLLRDKFNLYPTVFLTGSDQGNKEYIQDKIKEYNLESQVKLTGFLKYEEIKYLYTHATAMIFASLMGPNNMPPIEATFLNCPVIITDLDGHKEQLKDTALYFNGYKADELAENMNILLTDELFRTQVKEKEKQLAESLDKINYFLEIKKIIQEFHLIRKTWGKDYIHL